MGLVKVKKTFQIDSADRDIVKHQTNGDFIVYLPRSYKNVTSLRLKGAQFKQIPFFRTDSQLITWFDGKDPYNRDISNVVTPATGSTIGPLTNGNKADNGAIVRSGTFTYNNGITGGQRILDNIVALSITDITIFLVATYPVSMTGISDIYYSSQIIPINAKVLNVILQRSDTSSPGQVGIRSRISSPVSTSIPVYTDPITYVRYGTPQLIEIIVNDTASAIADINSNSVYVSVNSGNLNIGNIDPALLDNGVNTMQFTFPTPSGSILHEVIVFKNVISLEKRQNIEKYLSTKWNLDMPASHPVKNEILEKTPYYFLIEIEGLNRCDETCVGGNKSSFTDKYFAKIPAVANSDGIITYNDKNLQENINRYTPPIENLDRLHVKTRTHDQQNSDKFLAWSGDCNLTFEIEYMENELDVKTDEN
jgi:hypothetical protein